MKGASVGYIDRYVNADTFDRLFGIMIAVSAGAHIIFFLMALIVPPMFAPEPKHDNVIEISTIVNNLPKGPNVGMQASTKNQTAARRPDHELPWKKKKLEKKEMGYKKKTAKITSKRLNYKERQRESAIDKIKKLKEARTGGGGDAKKSGGNVYNVYFSRVRWKLRHAWTLPPGLSAEDKKKKAVVRIKIGSNGSIISAYIVRSSGLAHLDRSTLAAVSAVGTVPPPPGLIAKELASKGMSVTFDPMRK